MVSDKATYWQLHITKQENSDPSIKRYCQQADISENQFYYWRKKLQSADSNNKCNAVAESYIEKTKKSIDLLNVGHSPLTNLFIMS